MWFNEVKNDIEIVSNLNAMNGIQFEQWKLAGLIVIQALIYNQKIW